MAQRRKSGPNKKPSVRVTEQQLEDACEAVARGITLSAHCREPGRPTRSALWMHCVGKPEWMERFLKAREHGYDVIAEQVLELADAEVPKDDRGRTDTGLVAQRRLQADVRLRLLAKWCTARYGDRVQLAGDVNAPLEVRMSDADVWREVMHLLATAKSRQLNGKAPRAVREAGNRITAGDDA